MSFFTRLCGAAPRLALDQAEAVAEYRALHAPADDAAPAGVRLVVVDVEASGLDPYRDRLISIGAIALGEGLVRFEDSFHVVLRQTLASAEENILVHGIDGTTQLAGCEPADALASWLRYSGKAPLVGFHADFDRLMITRAARGALGMKPTNVWLDLAFLTPALFSAQAAAAATLDEWMRIFTIENYARHDALADALATAQLLQIVLAEAARVGVRNCGELRALEKNQRWLMQSMRR